MSTKPERLVTPERSEEDLDAGLRPKRLAEFIGQAQLRANLEGGLLATDSEEKLRELKCPTLLFTGDDDFNVGLGSLEDQAALIPDARVEIIPRCGHAPYVEQTEAFEGIVGEFVAEVEAREAAPASAGG